MRLLLPCQPALLAAAAKGALGELAVGGTRRWVDRGWPAIVEAWRSETPKHTGRVLTALRGRSEVGSFSQPTP